MSKDSSKKSTRTTIKKSLETGTKKPDKDRGPRTGKK